jgi:hypothetical protein
LPITLELAKSSLKSLANLASLFSKVVGTLPVVFLKLLENGRRLSKVAGAGITYGDLPATLEKALNNWLASLEKSVVFLQRL